MAIEYYKTKSCLLRLMLLESGLHDQTSLSKKLQLSTSGTKKMLKNLSEAALSFDDSYYKKKLWNLSIRKKGHGKTRFFTLNNGNIIIANVILTILYKQTAIKETTFNNYLSILTILANKNSLSKPKLELELLNKSNQNYGDNFDITKTLETLVSIGVLTKVKEKGSLVNYTMSDFYTHLSEETLAKLVIYINFSTQKNLFSVQGLLLNSTLLKYSQNNAIEIPKTKFKNSINANLLDEYIADILLNFITNYTPLRIVYSPNSSATNYNPSLKKTELKNMSSVNEKVDEKIFFIYPMLLIHDQFNCRWYLLGYSLYNKNKILHLRLDNIIHIQEASEAILKLKNSLASNSTFYSTSVLNKLKKQLYTLTKSYELINTQNSIVLHENNLNLKNKLKYSWQFDFTSEINEIKILFFTSNNPLLVNRLEREKQWGNLEINSDGNMLFTIKVRGLQEIRPWIYSFGRTAQVLYPLELKIIIKNKFKEMLSQYE